MYSQVYHCTHKQGKSEEQKWKYWGSWNISEAFGNDDFLYSLPSINLKYISLAKKNRNRTCTFKKSRGKNPTKKTIYSKTTKKKKKNNKEKEKRNTQRKWLQIENIHNKKYGWNTHKYSINHKKY